MALHALRRSVPVLLGIGLLASRVFARTGGGAGELTTLASFAGATGAQPYSGLLLGADGSFYGTTSQGGTNGLPIGFGTIFKLNPAGALTTLVFLSSNNGAKPYGSLIQTPNGLLYGTTWQGGISNLGTVFRVSTNGAFSSLISFTNGNGAQPSARLTLGSDGLLYGTTQFGGVSNQGTVFKATTNGVLTTLTSFSVTNGANPYAEIVQGFDGNFYGTTVDGGSANFGTVFRITTNGILTTLVSFGGTNGAKPYGGLVQHTNGFLYGTTAYGGSSDNGTLYRVSTNGVLTTLYSFTGAGDGANPWSALLLGKDGYFYGTTILGGDLGSIPRGTLFQFTTNASLASLYSYSFDSSTNGISPYAPLIQDQSGNLYGTTYSGGAGLRGTAFRLKPAPQSIQATALPGNIFRLAWDGWLGKTYQVQYRTNLAQAGWLDLGNSFIATNSPVVVDTQATGQTRTYRVKLTLTP